MTQKLKHIIQLLISFDELSEEEQDAIAIQVSKVISKASTTDGTHTKTAEPIKKRIPGLEKGAYYIADDFDEELPDDFWLGRL